MVPFLYPDALKQISDAVRTPVLVGETMFSAEAHRELFEKRAVAMCHPDIIFAGGCLEMKKICDFAEQYCIAAAIHMNNGPVAMFASVHSMGATNNFMCMGGTRRNNRGITNRLWSKPWAWIASTLEFISFFNCVL